MSRGYIGLEKQEIPVEWNGLTDSFEITIQPNNIEYNTTAFRSTGGGRF
jgi:hypothetical protein